MCSSADGKQQTHKDIKGKVSSIKIAALLNAQECRVLEKFALFNMKVSKTAEEVYMSDNGVRYTLRKIGEKTGVNPHTFYGLTFLLECAALKRERRKP